jgi:hypothetical protein
MKCGSVNKPWQEDKHYTMAETSNGIGPMAAIGKEICWAVLCPKIFGSF